MVPEVNRLSLPGADQSTGASAVEGMYPVTI